MSTTISPSLVPTIAPGNIFSRLTTDATLAIRWLVAKDPAYFDTLNRPIADIALRQLIIAKSLDAVNLRLGHQALFPYLIQPRLTSGTETIDVPLSWIWDMQVSLPRKWENVRLARIKRISGENGAGTAAEYTGRLRLVFTAVQEGSATQVAVFQADYTIDSVLSYQPVRVVVPTSSEESVVVGSGEAETIDGFITFRTLDTSDEVIQDFLTIVSPPVADTDADSDGEFDNPAIYQIDDSVAGGSSVSNDYSLSAIGHGTGLLTVSAFNPIPNLDSDSATWIAAFNYPMGEDSTRTSTSPAGITIPSGLFKEFNIVAPAGDEPTGDISGTFYPVWINRIRRDDASADALSFYFATYNTTLDAPSTVPIEFASLTLQRSDASGTVLAIVPDDNLLLEAASSTDFQQGFGRGHVVLSDLWDGTNATIIDFFDSFLTILDDPADVVFVKESTRLSAFAVARVPKFAPSEGQAGALRGSRAGTSDPSSTNRYVVEEDQGLGDTVDFATHADLTAANRENPDIERYGYSGALCRRLVTLIIDSDGTNHTYEANVEPRLTILFGRSPAHGDEWWDGTRIKTFIKIGSEAGFWVG